MVEPAENDVPSQPGTWRRCCTLPGLRGSQADRSRRAHHVVVPDVLAHHAAEMPLVDHNQMVEALAAERPNHAFGDGVRIRARTGVRTFVIPMPAPRATKSGP